MKLEIDFANPGALRQLEKELEAALATVRKALEYATEPAEPVEAISDNDAVAVLNAIAGDDGVTLANVFASLPSEFRTIDAIAAGEKANFSGSAMRAYLTQLVQSKRLTLVEKGQGRRPSLYRKQ